MRIFGLPLLILVLILSSCASSQPIQKSNLTPGVVETKVVKGVTTQNEILEIFGAPNIVTKNKGGNEVWTYDKVSMEQKASDVYGTLILFGGSMARASSSARTFTLMIEFDESKVVKESSYRSSSF